MLKLKCKNAGKKRVELKKKKKGDGLCEVYFVLVCISTEFLSGAPSVARLPAWVAACWKEKRFLAFRASHLLSECLGGCGRGGWPLRAAPKEPLTIR